jgi:hypothetical protein
MGRIRAVRSWGRKTVDRSDRLISQTISSHVRQAMPGTCLQPKERRLADRPLRRFSYSGRPCRDRVWKTRLVSALHRRTPAKPSNAEDGSQNVKTEMRMVD